MSSLFVKNILNTTIQLKPNQLGDNIDEIILDKLKTKVEGKCDRNGYIKPDSVKIIKRSMGNITLGNFNGSCNFRVSYQVDICNPVEGMIIKGVVRNLNKMGLFCEVHDINPSPLTIILAKQHHLKNENFEKIKLDDVISIEIIGVKFDYNETQISCIGRLSIDGKTLESEIENDETDEEEIKLEDSSDNDTDDSQEGLDSDNDMDKNDNSEEDSNSKINNSEDNENSLSNSNSKKETGKKIDIISMIGGSLNQNDLETENVEANNLELNDEIDLENNLDFNAEPLDLDAISRENTEPIYLNENYEIPEKITSDIFNKEIKINDNYKPFIKKPSNKINCYINMILSDLFISFYEKYGVKPKKLSLSTRNKYFKSIKNYMRINASSYELEENNYRTFIC